MSDVKKPGHVELDSEDEALLLSQPDQKLNKLPENVPHETYRPNDGNVTVPHETYRPDNRKRTADIVNSDMKRVQTMAPDGKPVRLPSTAYLRTIPSPKIPAPPMQYVQPDPAVLAKYVTAKQSK